MKKVMSIAAVALMLAGTTALAGDGCKSKSECKKDAKAECSSEKGKECSQKADAKECKSGCSKKS